MRWLKALLALRLATAFNTSFPPPLPPVDPFPHPVDWVQLLPELGTSQPPRLA